MNPNIISKAISKAVEAKSEKTHEGYIMVNIRPGEKVSAMLDVLSHLNGKTPSEIIGQALSGKLAEYAASSPDHGSAILDALEQVMTDHGNPHENSALGILKKEGLVKISNPFIAKVALPKKK
ncbi:hypothetical protein NOV72_01563 [Caballeronia novacaledonica]|uniref:Uncharacterized protein n=1 Tax=Caballeronia novacaledonica TaxID=1544861 RepID=A0A2U3I2I8_9BURK|nr:hypothetical protein [Caballeronia novacaledonica]SPB14313.1 hypothetical protein NOV72_01563 [Caballeronia novacaledonica]